MTAPGTTHIRQVQFMALGFWLLFNAYSAAQILQTAINGSAGYACLGVLYGLFAVMAVVAPTLVSKYGFLLVIPVSAVPYVLMVAVNMMPSLATLIPACGGVGIAAATLWSAQSMYVGKAALQYAETTGLPVTKAMSLLNAKFYAIFASSGGFSNIMASIIIMSAKDAIKTLFVYLTIVGTIAVVVLFMLAEPTDAEHIYNRKLPCFRPKKQVEPRIVTEDSLAKGYDQTDLVRSDSAVPQTLNGQPQSSPESDTVANPIIPINNTQTNVGAAAMPIAGSAGAGMAGEAGVAVQGDAEKGIGGKQEAEPAIPVKPISIPSVAYMARFLCKPEIRYMTCMLLTSGLGVGMFNGMWMGAIVAKGIGVGYVGFVGAAYSFTSAIATIVWGKLTQRASFGRRWAIVCAIIIHLVFLFISALWAHNYVDGIKPMPDIYVAFPLFVCLAMLYACADSVWFSQLQATLQTFFPHGDDAPCAMASIRLYNSIGFSGAIVISSMMPQFVTIQLIFQAVCLLASAYSMRHLHKHVAPIDAVVPPAAASAASAKA